MSADSQTLPDDGEHYVVSTAAFVAMVDIVDALNGIAQLTAGRLNDGDPEVGRNDLAAVFRVVGWQLNAQLQALPHRMGEAA